MESVLKNEKLIEAVRLFPCLWQVNTKSYKDVVAKQTKTPTLLALGKNWPCPEPPLPHPPFVLAKQSRKKQCFLVFFIAGAIHLLFHLFNFFTNYARALRLIRIHVVQTLGTLNCEWSSATPLRPTLTLRS